MPRLPQSNETDPEKDKCQTPDYALDPLLPYIRQFRRIWEPARGEGYLVRAIRAALPDAEIIEGDILLGIDYFTTPVPTHDFQLTNVPFSKKIRWLERAYAIGLPFALLMPVATSGTAGAQKLFDRYGAELIYMSPRINYKMPNAGWSGKGAQFASYWVTWGLNIGKENTYARVKRRPQPEYADAPIIPPASIQIPLWEEYEYAEHH